MLRRNAIRSDLIIIFKINKKKPLYSKGVGSHQCPNKYLGCLWSVVIPLFIIQLGQNYLNFNYFNSIYFNLQICLTVGMQNNYVNLE